MCDRDAAPAGPRFSALISQTRSGAPADAPCAAPAASTSSRRKRLWELPQQCHCPLIGVCLPLDVLRRTLHKVLAGEVMADEYEVHVGVVAQCSVRNVVSEAMQRELDRRCALAVRRFAQAKNTDALRAAWRAAVRGGDVTGALWATFTHPRCDAALLEDVCRDIHMIQHQAGAMQRADLNRLEALEQSQRGLTQELARTQERLLQAQAERAAEQERQGALLMQLRAESIRKDTLVASLQGELAALRQSMPELQSRMHLSQRAADLTLRNRALEQELAELKREVARAERVADETARRHAALQAEAVPDAPQASPTPPDLGERCVLCVGGRHASVPQYRDLVERCGGRFVHHDGGIEDNTHRLDASLAAADLVICQTGCLSHNAYWLVKDHCKRTGKRCVYLDKPSVAGFARGLAQLPIAPMQPTEDTPG